MTTNNNRVRKVTITFPLFPQDFDEIINELVCIDCSFEYNAYNSSITTFLTDETIRTFKDTYSHVNMDVHPLSEELFDKAYNILLKSEDNCLDIYHTPVHTQGSHGDDVFYCVVSAEIQDEDVEEIIFHDEYGLEIPTHNLSEEDKYNLYQAIINCAQD